MSDENPAPKLIGKFLKSTPPAEGEQDHLLQCPVCGQAVDCSDLAQVFHHARRVHEPLIDP